MNSPLRILHLEDNSDDAELARNALESGGVDCVTTRVQSRADFIAALHQQRPDLVLADFSLPGFDGLAALHLVRTLSADVPFILVSGTVGEERAIESLKSGATDYVLKGRLTRLVPAVRRAMAEVEQRAERHRAEAAREETSRKLQVLSRRLVETQEKERRHIARELHDEIGQTLTLAQLNLQAVLSQPELIVARPRLFECLAAIERVLEQVHDISLNLRPSMLDDLGLEATLRWYTNRQASLMGWQTRFVAPPLGPRLDARIETECFRIAQEALTNVMRHAQAKTVTVHLLQDNGQIQLCIADDGMGFTVKSGRDNAVNGVSMGLLSMEERAALMGGRLEIKSSVGQGTEIRAWLPLHWHDGKPSFTT
jgi:signal transduction histidine kinase